MVLKYNNDDGSSFVFLCSYSRHYILVCGIEIFETCIAVRIRFSAWGIYSLIALLGRALIQNRALVRDWALFFFFFFLRNNRMRKKILESVFILKKTHEKFLL